MLFELSGSGSTWSQSWVHNFPSSTEDGTAPAGPPLLVSGELYGASAAGGQSGAGVIYKLKKHGSAYQVIHTFSGNPAVSPAGPLVADSSGTLYGTTLLGGGTASGCDYSGGCGVAYSIKPDGSDFTVIHQFVGREGSSGDDGAAPENGVTLVNGNIFGTTSAGGSSGCTERVGPSGCGVIFELTPI